MVLVLRAHLFRASIHGCIRIRRKSNKPPTQSLCGWCLVCITSITREFTHLHTGAHACWGAATGILLQKAYFFSLIRSAISDGNSGVSALFGDLPATESSYSPTVGYPAFTLHSKVHIIQGILTTFCRFLTACIMAYMRQALQNMTMRIKHAPRTTCALPAGFIHAEE